MANAYVDILEINENGSSIYGTEYLKEAKWRTCLHRKNKTNYIQICTWRWNDGSVFDFLASELQRYGIAPQRKSELEILQEIRANRSDDWQDFLSLLRDFLSLHKNSGQKIIQIREKIARQNDSFESLRMERFLQIYASYYLSYEEWLLESRSYDFADMINNATRNVREISSCAAGYRYILLDEMQDLSRNRQELILEILHKNPGCKLFAVGDDWQSIYRFTGSNLMLVHNFEKFFKLRTRRSLIETTHRFAEPTVKLSSAFVQKNPIQVRKRIHTSKRGATPVEIIFNEAEDGARGSDVPAFGRAIIHLISIYGADALKAKSLQIISRYNHDVARLAGSKNIEITDEKITWHDQDITLDFEFCSMHKSKGITRDVVIVLNMNSGLMGMPAQRETDPILNLLLSQEDEYVYAEERRLFYVAITRARERTILLANRKNPSPFLFEICDDLAAEKGYFCPKCGFGELLYKNTSRGPVKYCSNFAFGCNYFKRE